MALHSLYVDVSLKKGTCACRQYIGPFRPFTVDPSRTKEILIPQNANLLGTSSSLTTFFGLVVFCIMYVILCQIKMKITLMRHKMIKILSMYVCIQGHLECVFIPKFVIGFKFSTNLKIALEEKIY